MPIHVGFTGSQNGMTPKQRRSVSAILSQLILQSENGPVHLHQGDCIGSDCDCCGISRILGRDKIHIISHPPDNPSRRAFYQSDEERATKPYLDRNRDIVDESTLLIATPKNQQGEILRSGTWATIRYAKKKGRYVLIVRPDGGVEQWHGTYRKKKEKAS